MQRAAPLTLVLVAYAVLSTSALVAQVAEPADEPGVPIVEVPAEESAAPAGGDAEESVEGGTDTDASERGMHRGERPQRIRMEERNELQEQSRQQEEVGKLIEQQIERALDAGEDIPDFEIMKEHAKDQLFEASESHAEQDGVSMAGEHRVCFRSDGSVTDQRVECDPDQSSHFGIQEEAMQGDRGGNSGFAPVSDESMQEHMDERFEQPAFVSGDLTGIVSEALERLGTMMTQMQANPAAMAQIQETITFLSGVLRQQSAGQVPADIAEQIRMRLERIIQTVGSAESGGSPYEEHHEFGGPDMNRVIAMMEKMIPKLPQVIAIFDEEGVPVDPDARAAAEEAVSTFDRLKGPCIQGDMDACKELGKVMGGIESRMRPPMEKAMMETGRFDLGIKIQALMGEDMEGMEGMGPPPGMLEDSHQGPPQGFDPSQFRSPSPGMHSGYGNPPPGMEDGSYGRSPEGFYPSSYNHGGMPSSYPMPSGMDNRGYDPSFMQHDGGSYEYPMHQDGGSEQ